MRHSAVNAMTADLFHKEQTYGWVLLAFLFPLNYFCRVIQPVLHNHTSFDIFALPLTRRENKAHKPTVIRLKHQPFECQFSNYFIRA